MLIYPDGGYELLTRKQFEELSKESNYLLSFAGMVAEGSFLCFLPPSDAKVQPERPRVKSLHVKYCKSLSFSLILTEKKLRQLLPVYLFSPSFKGISKASHKAFSFLTFISTYTLVQ